MTESIDWNDGEDEDDRQPAGEGPGLFERFKRYLAARRTAGLGPSDPDTDETERLWP